MAMRLAGAARLDVLCIATDELTTRVASAALGLDQVRTAASIQDGIELARASSPDIALVDVSSQDGGGVALVHHLRVVAPAAVIVAVVRPDRMQAAADAIGLGATSVVLLPLGGDDVSSIATAVRARLAERQQLAELEREAHLRARAAGWTSRLSALTDAPDRGAVSRGFAEVLEEATSSGGVAVYLPMGNDYRSFEAGARTGELAELPGHASLGELEELSRAKRLTTMPLSVRGQRVAEVLVAAAKAPPSLAPPSAQREAFDRAPLGGTTPASRSQTVADGLLPLLRSQAAAALALLADRDDHGRGGSLKDPQSSAYSFAYYVDAAGREIDRARRHHRRFSVATLLVEAPDQGSDSGDPPTPSDFAEWVLRATNDTDLLARVDEHEFHILMFETDGFTAQGCRRRVLARILEGDKSGLLAPRSALVGVATFPHDGEGLARLMGIARRRAEATRGSVVHQLAGDVAGLGDLFEQIAAFAMRPPRLSTDARDGALSAPRLLELEASELAALGASVVEEAARAGAVQVTTLDRSGTELGARVRRLAESGGGGGSGPVTHYLLDGTSTTTKIPEDLVVMVLAGEQASYTLLARVTEQRARCVHASDILLVDLVAERLGRATGMRVGT